MKAQIEIDATLYRKACVEAKKQHCTIEEWLGGAVERQLKQTDSLRNFIDEKSKGASKSKALSALRKIGKAMEGEPVVEGDEMPSLN